MVMQFGAARFLHWADIIQMVALVATTPTKANRA